VDTFAGRLSFFFAIGMNFFMEVAKLRAARLLWHRIMVEFNPKNQNSLVLRTHCQTSGVSLQEQDPYNNIVRTAYEAMSAVLGGTQSLHTNSFDEAMALPTAFSSRIARNTQLILQNETKVTKVIDPLAGSYYVEKLTSEIAEEAWKLILEIDELGGMTKAVAAGMPKLKIEEAAATRQALVDQGEEVIVGVNKYKLEKQDGVDILEVDNVAVRESQILRINKVKNSRKPLECQAALGELEQAAFSGKDNLLSLAIVAARARATVGEISMAMENSFGRHSAEIRTLSGVYGAAYDGDKDFEEIQKSVKEFAQKEGRRPRMMVVKMGQDGHDRGAKVIATAFADIGFDIDVGPLFQTPKEAAQAAIDNDVHIVGISSQAAGHKTLAPKLVEALRLAGASEIIVICGGVIPQKDYKFLYDRGVSAIFGPGTNIPDAARNIIDMIRKSKENPLNSK
jgi:methylmalonyl-CoA mutase